MRKLSRINESLWKSGINRSKQGTLRKEDIISLDDAADFYKINIDFFHKVEDYDNFFFTFGGDNMRKHIYIYHYPIELSIAKIYLNKDYTISTKSDDYVIYNNSSDEDEKLLQSKEFIDVLNKSIYNLELKW